MKAAFAVIVLSCAACAGGVDSSEDPGRAADSSVCDQYCDRRDPALARADRHAATATIFSRQIILHVSDTDRMAWASIDDGDPSDEVWMDRSFDGGRSWSSGSKLGDTTIPAGRRGWRTMMYNVDDPGHEGVGVVRACGKAGNRSQIACSGWARLVAADRVRGATTALLELYDVGTGLWPSTGWWNSANALTALVDSMRATGDKTYEYALANTFAKNDGAAKGSFRNDYLDDTAWWALAWIRAYDLTGDPRYLQTAKRDADYIYGFRDDHCGGGIWWSSARTYKNAITNELFIKLAASLHNRLAGDTTYRARAEEIWGWFQRSGMINGEHLVNDGLDTTTCKNNGGTTWSYNQGVILGALVELHAATADDTLLATAREIAGAATTSAFLNPGGVLTEPCERGSCGGDAPTFKGVFARNLGELDRSLTDRPFHAYLTRQADAAFADDRDGLDQYGLHWAGPFDGSDGARQQSALDLLTAAR